MSALGSDLAVALALSRLPIVVAAAAAGRVSPPGGPMGSIHRTTAPSFSAIFFVALCDKSTYGGRYTRKEVIQ
jgi:hypothetical protein